MEVSSYMRKHWKFLTILLTLAVFLTIAFAGAALAGDNRAAAARVSPDPNAGLVIVAVDDAAAEAGLVRGDVLLEINGQAVNDASDWLKATAALAAGERVSLLVRHGDEVRELELAVAERNGAPDFGFQPYFENGMIMGELSTLPFRRLLAPEADVEIVEVTAGSPAEEAGLQVGDRIVAIDGRQLGLDDDFAALIAARDPGDGITLTLERDGEQQEVEVTLGEHPERQDSAFLGIRFRQASRQFEQAPFQGRTLPFGRSFETPAAEGALLARVQADSPASAAGLRRGDIVTAADDQTVATAQDLIDILAQHRPGDSIPLEVQRAGQRATRTVEVELGEHPDRAGAAYLGVELRDAVWLEQLQPNGDQPQNPNLDQLFRFFQNLPGQDQMPDLELPFDLMELLRKFGPPGVPQAPGDESGGSLDL